MLDGARTHDRKDVWCFSKKVCKSLDMLIMSVKRASRAYHHLDSRSLLRSNFFQYLRDREMLCCGSTWLSTFLLQISLRGRHKLPSAQSFPRYNYHALIEAYWDHLRFQISEGCRPFALIQGERSQPMLTGLIVRLDDNPSRMI
jgi:hypothetical protein